MSSTKKINIKIQQQSMPFQAQYTQDDTLLILKNKLYIKHQKIVDMIAFINGKIQIKDMNIRLTTLIQKNPELVFLLFCNKNSVVSSVTDNKALGLSDPTMKPQGVKNFQAPTIDPSKQVLTQPTLKGMDISKQLTASTSKSVRITDLSHTEFIKLLQILKIENGRYVDQKLQINTSNREALNYTIADTHYTDIIEDKGISHFFQNQSITSSTKEICLQGYGYKYLGNKVPYLLALSYNGEESYFKNGRQFGKADNTYVEHCFPRGEVNLIVAAAQPREQLTKYFDDANFCYDNIMKFYTNFGQFVIKKFTVGLKRVCTQKITSQTALSNQEEIEKYSALTAGRIKQYMLESTNQFSKGSKGAQTQTKTSDESRYDIKAIGGAIEYCENVVLWKQSVNIWQLWRIIAVNQVERIQNYLQKQVRQRIYECLQNKVRQIEIDYQTKKMQNLALSNQISPSKEILKIQSNFSTLMSFPTRIYQILPLDEENLIIVFIDKVIRYHLPTNSVTFSLEFREYNSTCLHPQESGYLTATVDNNCVYIATENGIVEVDIGRLSFRQVVGGNWRYSSLLISYKNKLYANGFKGIYQIDPKTGSTLIIIGGDWRGYTGTRIHNTVYLFHWNIYCLDMESLKYSKIDSGLWNEYWDNYTYPTNDGMKIYHLYKRSLYCLMGQKYWIVQFVKNAVNFGNFNSRCLCYHGGAIYIPNWDRNQHLMKIPIN